jgi:16S rRNA G966 N2-methylase RsmD
MTVDGWSGPIHPAADLFPLMQGDEFEALVESVKTQGLREPVWLTKDGELLDGRNRVRACQAAGVKPEFRQYDGDDPVAFVWDTNVTRRHLTETQIGVAAIKRGELERASSEVAPVGRPRKTVLHGGQLLDTPPVRGKRAVEVAADRAGVSRATIERIDRVRREAPELLPEMEKGVMSAREAERRVKERARAERREQEATQRQELIKTGTRVDLRLGDFRQVLSDITDVDAIITDPPYPKEYLPLLDDLAEFAQRALKPTGVMAVMMGQSYLPEVFARLNGQLPYLWTIAYLTPGGQAVQVWDRKVNTFWKPVLVYGTTADWFGDVTKSEVNDNDKRHHHWGQSASGMVDIVQRLTKPGAHIVDPFLGAGTTALAALTNGCHFTGCDIDPDFVARSQERLDKWAA